VSIDIDQKKILLSNMTEKKQIIQQSILFSGLQEAMLDRVAVLSHEKNFAKGESVFFEGDEATGFYMVAEGRVKIFKMSLDGREQILHIFGQGEPFGEVPVFHGQPFPANAVTLVKSRLLFFPRKDFVELVTTTPALALSMLAMLSFRLRRFASQIESLSLKEVPGRLAGHLIYLAEEQGRTDQVVLDIPKGQLASLLGTSPETLSRIFSKMSDEELIEVKGKTIVIKNYEELLEM
jgi:CRP/FNR family transcriptional regulator